MTGFAKPYRARSCRPRLRSREFILRLLERFLSPSRKRLLVLLAVSLMLHALLLGLVPTWNHAPDTGPTRLTATLVPLPAVPTTSRAPALARPKKPRATHPHPHPAPPPAPALSPEAPVELASKTAMDQVATPNGPVPDTRGNSTDAGDSTPAPVPPEAAPATPPPPATPAVDPPNSATLYYEVMAKDPRRDPNQSLVGDGVMTWALDRDHYTLDLSATVKLLFLSLKVLESHSEGAIDAQGLEPARYVETPRNRQSLITLFNRGVNDPGIHAGESPLVAPGVQDRLSVVFQLGALLRANPALTESTAQFDVPVAGLRGEVSNWTFFVFGTEEVVTPLGTLHAIHLLRLLRRGTNDRELEVWIALDRGGYPVRIRYTEPNESYVELNLSKIQ